MSLLAKNNVKLSLISIGTPETGRKLLDHLGIANNANGSSSGDNEEEGEWIFADPENNAYDKLALNRGWDTMVRPATAFRFRDRIFGGGKSASLDQVSRY